MHGPRLLAPAALAAVALALTACSGAASGATRPSTAGKVDVVASTDVWGSVAKAVGGDHVAVTSIIDDPAKDPHEYQASARNQLAISQAELVIDNGGGYDDFVTKMVRAAKQHPTVVTAADVSSRDRHPSGGEFNEHLWYDFPTVQKVADRLADAFAKADRKDAADFHANAKSFDAKLAGLEAREAELKSTYAGTPVAITEPVPLYLLDAIGLDNVTPEKFSEAVENDSDVAPAVLMQTLDLFRDRKVELLVYNEQAGGPQTQSVVDAAKKNGAQIVPVTETLPGGKNYLEWMTANLDAIGKALGD
jgi:zinc/manganese transport system substrate-binding protein